MTGLLLHVAVPAGEAPGALGRALGARSVACGPVAAILGPVRREGTTRAALRHARIVGHALETCSSVVPFRAGIEVGSERDARALLAENREELSVRLQELAGHVEMGLKVRIPHEASPARRASRPPSSGSARWPPEASTGRNAGRPCRGRRSSRPAT